MAKKKTAKVEEVQGLEENTPEEDLVEAPVVFPEFFKDKNDLEWTPRMDTPALMESSRQLNLTLGKITSLDLTIGDLVDLVWYCCKYQAKPRRITREEFLESVELAQIRQGVMCLFGAVQKAFPEVQQVDIESLEMPILGNFKT